MLLRMQRGIGDWLAAYLERPVRSYAAFDVTEPALLSRVLQPADVLLVDGRVRVSMAIKYLTQSTWSHATMYVGQRNLQGRELDGEPCVLVEATLTTGVHAVPLSVYAGHNTRICRPIGLTKQDRDGVIEFVLKRLGASYDVQNVIDLARYLLPTPPVPLHLRRRMLALGSGEPTRAICSTLIAQAFQSVKYPILPEIQRQAAGREGRRNVREILHIRHHSLFTPRDFDVSPFFAVVKPTLELGFDYKTLTWGEPASAPGGGPGGRPGGRRSEPFPPDPGIR